MVLNNGEGWWSDGSGGGQRRPGFKKFRIFYFSFLCFLFLVFSNLIFLIKLNGKIKKLKKREKGKVLVVDGGQICNTIFLALVLN